MNKAATILFSLIIVFGIWGNVNGQDSTDAWINEFHYDNVSTDEGEFVEVVIKDAESYEDLSLFVVTLYNGDGGSTYGTHSLDTFLEGVSIGNYTFYYKAISGIQNGAPDGFSLTYHDTETTVIQTLSYEGTFEATDGLAIGEESEDVGVSETGTATAPVGHSLQLTGSGYGYGDFAWTGPSDDSPGAANEGQFLYPTVQFSSSGATVNEADGTINIEIEILNPDGNNVAVDVVFQQNPSSAQTTDFSTSTTQTVNFTDGDPKNASFTLNNGDSNYEGTETAEFILTNISTSGDAEIDGQTEYTLTIEDDDTPDVVINEIHAAPNTDINNDGNNSSTQDEFVEFLNNESVSVDISDWKVLDAGGIQFSFPSNTILSPNGSVVVFGGGTPDGSFGGVLIKTAGSLSLNNTGGESVILKDDLDNTIDSYSYTSAPSGISFAREPEGSGEFGNHPATGPGGATYSPGTKADGSLFTTALVIEGNAGWRMLSAPVANMPISELTDDTPIQGYKVDDEDDMNFYSGYDGFNFTPADNLDGNLNSGEGFILYFYNNNDFNSSTLPVVIDVGSNSEPDTAVTVAVHCIADGTDGWNLLGNPYQTAFDVTTLKESENASLASVEEDIVFGQIWSDADESYISTITNDNKVAPGQGFFVQVGVAGKLTFPLSGKATGTRFYKESNQEKGFVQFELISSDKTTGKTHRDISALLYFNDEAFEGWDKWDAEKLYPLKASFSILNLMGERDGNPVTKTQDSRPFENLGNESYYMDIEAVNVAQLHTLKLKQVSNIPDEWQFTLKDNVTGKEIPFSNDLSYTFNVVPSSNEETSVAKAAKQASVKSEVEEPRFTLVLNKGTITNMERQEAPQQFALHQNYPNPFNPTTNIKYSIAKSGEVSLTIYNVMGQKVAMLVNEVKSAGNYQVNWDAANMASGVYYYRLQSAGQIETRQMTLIK